MTLDTEDHRALLLNLINATPFQGVMVEQVYALKQALINAAVGTANWEGGAAAMLESR